jgi:DNA-binding transcriptional MerR regulator
MQKLYYSISEVSRMVDEEQHILRYWEKEFPGIKPRKNRAGNRIYSDDDIHYIRAVKNLIRGEKLSLKGAKEKMQDFTPGEIPDDNLFSSHDTKPQPQTATNGFGEEDLQELKDLLSEISAFLKK